MQADDTQDEERQFKAERRGGNYGANTQVLSAQLPSLTWPHTRLVKPLSRQLHKGRSHCVLAKVLKRLQLSERLQQAPSKPPLQASVVEAQPCP